METEKLVEKLLNEGLELLSSEKKQKQKKGFGSIRAAWGVGSMVTAYYEGICYKNGIGIYQSDEQAFDCFRKAAEEKSPDAFFSVGNCYLNGLGVDKNDKETAYWFKKAAETGELDSMFHFDCEYLLSTLR